MTTYNTGNPLGSTAAKDLFDNAQNFDDAMNSLLPFFNDRFGQARKTWSGFEQDVATFFANIGYETPVPYVAGIDIIRYSQTVVKDGELYAPYVASVPFTTTNWATDEAKFKAIGDVALRTALASATGGTNVGYKARNVHVRLEDRSSLEDQSGVTGNGIASDLTPLNAAIAAARGRHLMLNDKTYMVPSRPTNPYGVEYEGNGVIGQQVTVAGSPYLRQINTYSDKLKLHIGLEYCQRLWTAMVNDAPVNSFFYGDSTIQGGNGESFEYQLEQIIPNMMTEKGYPNFLLTNRGIAGSKVSGWNTAYLTDPSATTDLMVFKGAINDASNPVATRLATYQADLESVFSQIRALPFGSVQQVTLVLMGPNATNDLPNGRDPKFYEQLRGIHVEICHKYQVAFFDTYGMMPDADNGAGTWLDAPAIVGAPAIGIHPMNVGQSWIWGELLDFICPSTAMGVFKKNHDLNSGAASGAPTAALPATSFPFGRSLYRATPTDGWYVDGVVETIRHVDGPTIQRNYGFANNSMVTVTRTWSVTGGIWAPPTGVEIPIVYANGWVAFGSGLATGSVTVGADGVATVEFAMKDGTITAATVFANLPTGILPKYTNVVPVAMSGGTVGFIRYNTLGELKLEAPGNATLTSGAFSFRIAQ